MTGKPHQPAGLRRRDDLKGSGAPHLALKTRQSQREPAHLLGQGDLAALRGTGLPSGPRDGVASRGAERHTRSWLQGSLKGSGAFS